ncbi:hypothetical protein Esti_004414 [Eimeria stiedai]
MLRKSGSCWFPALDTLRLHRIDTTGLFAASLQELLQRVPQQQPQQKEQQQQQTGRPPRVGVVEDTPAAKAMAVFERGGSSLPALLQLQLLVASAVPLQRAAAPQLEVRPRAARAAAGREQLQKLQQLIFPTRVDFVPNGGCASSAADGIFHKLQMRLGDSSGSSSKGSSSSKGEQRQQGQKEHQEKRVQMLLQDEQDC